LKDNAPPPLPFDGSLLPPPQALPAPAALSRLWWIAGAVVVLLAGGLGIWRLAGGWPPGQEMQVALKTTLGANRSAIDLGVIPAGSSKTFDLEIQNSGAIAADSIQVHLPAPVSLDKPAPIQILPGQVQTLHFKLKTNGLESGKQKHDLVISGSNLNQSLTIPVTFTINTTKSGSATGSTTVSRAKLRAENSVIELGRFAEGTSKTFEIKITNRGAVAAENIRISKPQGIAITGVAPDRIRAGKSEKLRFNLNTNNLQKGDHTLRIRITGDNLDQDLSIPVQFTLLPPVPPKKGGSGVPPPERPTITVNCNIGRPHCSFRFTDTVQNKQVTGKSNWHYDSGQAGEKTCGRKN